MNWHKQRGVTLLSLLVGMAIGIFLVGATIKVYVDSKTAFNVRNVVADVSENQRFALDDLRRILVMVGRDIRAVEDNNASRRAFPPVTNNAGTATASGAEFIYDGGSGASDIIAIRYRRGPSCGAYQNVSDGTPPSMVRFLLADTDGDGATDDLVCELKTYGGSTTTTRQTLVSGIQMLKALYGVDDDGDGYANRYLTASEVDSLTSPSGSNTPWALVVTMRVGLVAGSEVDLPPQAQKSSAGTLSVLGMDFTEPDTSHLYRAASVTLALRNLNPVVSRQ